jgi:hypothetical protein
VIPFLGHSDATEHPEPNRIPVFTLGASRRSATPSSLYWPRGGRTAKGWAWHYGQERRSVFEPATGRLKSSFRESISRYRVSGNLVLRHRLGELLKSHAGSEVCAEVENGQGKEVSPVFGAGTVLLPDPRPGRSPGRKHPRPQVSSPAVARGERADRPVGLISGDSVQVNSIQYCQSCFRSVRFADCRSVSSSRA